MTLLCVYCGLPIILEDQAEMLPLAGIASGPQFCSEVCWTSFSLESEAESMQAPQIAQE